MKKAPYKYLDYYSYEDADIFFGREEDVNKVIGEILSTRLLVLFSPSGSGKTSLINAGVRPRLEKMGYATVYTRLEAEPIKSVCEAVAKSLDIQANINNDDLHEFLVKAAKKVDKPIVIFLDQFEEFFIIFRNNPVLRKDFIKQIASVRYDVQLPVFLVFSLREDYYVNLHEFREEIPSIFQNNANIRLGRFTDEEARRVIEQPLITLGFHFCDGLADAIIEDLKNGEPGIEPIALQIICYNLWKNKPKNSDTLKLAGTEAAGHFREILSRNISEQIERVPLQKQRLMVNVFKSLKTTDNTKRYRPIEDIQESLKVKKRSRLEPLLVQLSDLNLLRREEKAGTQWFEFKHDYVVGEINKWIKKRDEKLALRRLIYGIASPFALFILGFLGYLFIEYHTFYATFSAKTYESQINEIIITRGFDFFNKKISTGYMITDLKSQTLEQTIYDKSKINRFNKNDWSALADILRESIAGTFLYQIGKHEAGIDALISTVKEGDYMRNDEFVQELWILSRSDNLLTTALIKAFNDNNNDKSFRAKLVNVLGLTKQSDDRVIELLVKTINDTSNDESIRVTSAYALGSLGKSDDRIINVLVDALIPKDNKNDQIDSADSKFAFLNQSYDEDDPLYYEKSTNLKAAAASALGSLGRSDDKVINVLVNALQKKESDIDVKTAAASALGSLGRSDDKVINALIEVLLCKESKSYLKELAASALGSLGRSDDKVINAMIDALQNKGGDKYLWVAAARALGSLGRSDDKVINALVYALQKKDSDKYSDNYLKKAAASALGSLGRLDDKAINALVNALQKKESDIDVKKAAARALGSLGRSDDKVINALVDALQKKESGIDVKIAAASALGSLGRSDDKVINALVDGLQKKESDPYLKRVAASALGSLGRSDDKVINALVDALQKKVSDITLKAAAASALGSLGRSDEKVVNALIDALQNKDSVIVLKGAAASALVSLGRSDDKVINALIEVLLNKESERYLKESATSVLGSLGRSDDKTIDALIKVFKDKESNQYLRRKIAEALGLFVKANDTIIEILGYALFDKDLKVREITKKALGKLFDEYPASELFKYLQHDQIVYRTAGIEALVRKDTISQEIINKINQLKDRDKRPWIRLSAWDAYEKIQERLDAEAEAANEIVHADSLFAVHNYIKAQAAYNVAFFSLTDIVHIDSLKAAYTKFKQARCEVKMKDKTGALNNLEVAIQYNPFIKDTLINEMGNNASDWKIIKDNWYLNKLLNKGNR